MKRKLIKQGANALTVTLPKAWIQQHKLTARDEINITSTDHALLITAEKQTKTQTQTLHLPTMDVHGYRHFIYNAYRQGFDEITISFDAIAQFPVIRSATEELLGFEIIHQTPRSVTLKSVAVPDHKEYPALFRRTFHIITTAFSYLSESIVAKHFDATNLQALRKDLLRLCNFCERLLHQNIAFHKEPHIDYLLLTLNDAVLGQLQQVYTSAQKMMKPSKEILTYIDELTQFFEQITAIVFRDNKASELISLIQKKYQFYELKKERINNSKPDERELCQELGILLRLLTDYACPLSLIQFRN